MILDFPTSFPSELFNMIPCLISFDLISIKFRQPADPTAKYEITKFRKTDQDPLNLFWNGAIAFLTPSPTKIELVTAAE